MDMAFSMSLKESFFSFYKTLDICYSYIHEKHVILLFLLSIQLSSLSSFICLLHSVDLIFFLSSISLLYCYPSTVLKRYVFIEHITIIVVGIYCHTT